ncbi:MAG TPA: hypothetical protein VM509_09030, partial [Planctomycetota bacterium]|nr:hypothetical protein [Planctomycetota bacterium]
MTPAIRTTELDAGDVLVHWHASRLLEGNRAGDLAARELPIDVPHAVRDGVRRPGVFLLAGFTGDGREFLETHPWRRGVVLEYDAAVRAGTIAP